MKKLLLMFLLAASLTAAQTQVNPSETIFTASKVTFTATVDGTTPITVAWYKDNVLLTTNVTTTANQTAVVNDVLTFTSIQLTDAGTYKVVATNVAGTGESSPLAVIVVTPVGPNNVKIFIKRG